VGLEVREDAGSGRLRLIGDLDLSTLEAFRSGVDDLTGPADVTLDLSELAFIDSSGIRAMLQVHLALRAEGRRLVLLAPTPFVRRVFDTLELAGNGVDIRDEDQPQP
jgi:anti-sigma B factor antagonist